MSGRSNRPFPVKGARVTDGEGLSPSTIPGWMAEMAFAQLKHIGYPVTLESIEREGGWAPMVLLDLLAFGDGTGNTYRRKLAERLAAGKPGIVVVSPEEIPADTVELPTTTEIVE